MFNKSSSSFTGNMLHQIKETNWFMQFREKTTVYTEDHTNHVPTLYEYRQSFLMLNKIVIIVPIVL